VRNATRPSVPLKFKPVEWKVFDAKGTLVHIGTSFSGMHEWFASHPEVEYDYCTIRRNGSVVHHALRTP